MSRPIQRINHSSMVGKPLFELNRETISYNGINALADITLKIDAGEKIALIGSSGAGKTTLLRRLYQLKPQDCGFIHQHYALVSQLSTFHNIYMGRLDFHSVLHNIRTLIRPAKQEIKEIRKIARQLGLEEKLWDKIGTLSGGQQQRVGIGRALYRGGSILMADEPVSSLDIVQGRDIVKLITGIGTTVISAMHYVELSLEFFDRIIGLHDHRILFDLPSHEVSAKHLERLYS